MGGSGSGEWLRTNRKYTVEESLRLAIKAIPVNDMSDESGMLSWEIQDNNGDFQEVANLKWSFIAENTYRQIKPMVILEYQLQDGEDIQQAIDLQRTNTQFNGHRWWFTCPLQSCGKACQRRVAKLYFPPGGMSFGCRQCLALSYLVCQESHQIDRMADKLVELMNCKKEIALGVARRMTGRR